MPKVTLPDGRVVHFPDDMPMAQIEAEASRLSKAVTSTPSPASERTWADTASDLLPTAGGIAGGVIGGIGGTVAGMGVGGVPGAVGGATLGGAAGESLRQIVNRLRGADAPDTPLDALSSIGTQGAIQGGSELIGAGVAKGAAAGAKAVYRGYLKPSLAANKLGKANQIVETALNEALPITKGGTAKAQRVIDELRQEVGDVLDNTPGTIDLKTVADRVRAFAKQRYFKPGVDTADYQMALGVADKIDSHPSLGNGAQGALDRIRAYKGAYPYDDAGKPIEQFQSQGVKMKGVFDNYVGKKGGFAGFFSDDPAVAGRFVGPGSAMYQVDIEKFAKPLVIDAKGSLSAHLQFADMAKKPHEKAALMEMWDTLRGSNTGNYDGIIIKNTADEGTVYVPLDPKRVQMAIGAGAKPTSVDVSLKTANEAKQGLYTSIKEAGFGVPQGAKKSTEKFAAHELKTGLEKAAPAIAPLNARESKLIDAAKAISRAVEREANQNPIYGVKSLMATGAGLSVGGPEGAAAGFLGRQLLRPGVATSVAIVANRLSRELGIGTASATRLASYVLQDRASDEADTDGQ